jgi:hypothetical protein
MMQSYVDAGDMAPLVLFYSGPATWNFVNLLSGFYGTGYTPSFFCDGVFESVGWNQSACQNAINERLTTPSYLDINATMGGDETSGVVYYNITAEQDLEAVGMIRILSVLVETDVYAASGWGGYNGQTIHWLPRMSPLGTTGVELEYTGPYPQTISLQGEYTINPSWNYENLGLLTFVVDYSDKTVFNASYYQDLGSIMGIEGSASNVQLTVGPNPSNGSFSVFCSLPDGVTGSVDVFDVAGRCVESAASSQSNFSVAEAGLYFVRLNTNTGESITRSIVVTR